MRLWTWWRYWIRPYDSLADRRRWKWQPRQRCISFSFVDKEARP